MSAVIKTNRTRKLPVSAPVLWVVLGLAAALFLFRYGQEVLMEHDLNGQVAAQERKNAQMADENQRLQASLQYDQSDKYVEQRAREDLTLRRPDEEVLIPVGGSDAQNPAGSTGTGTQDGQNGAEGT